jgi:hypothetical protein
MKDAARFDRFADRLNTIVRPSASILNPRRHQQINPAFWQAELLAQDMQERVSAGVRVPGRHCDLCGRLLNTSEPDSRNCGGDCLGCMREIEREILKG